MAGQKEEEAKRRETEDTVRLLRECNSGVKMGISSIDEVVDRVKDGELRDLLDRARNTHCELGEDTGRLLDEYHDPEKEPSVMAKGMSWLKTNVMMLADPADHTVADLMTDGCNMGVKSLSRYLNQYATASEEARDLARRIIHAEENLVESLRAYL